MDICTCSRRVSGDNRVLLFDIKTTIMRLWFTISVRVKCSYGM